MTAAKKKTATAAAAREPVKARRNRENPEVRRKSLIEATRRSIAKNGFAGTTIEKICTEAKVSRGLINHHFGSKEELIRQSYKSLCDEWEYHAHDQADGVLSAEDELRSVIRTTFSPTLFKPEYLSAWLGFFSVIGKSRGLSKLNRDLSAGDLAVFLSLFERTAAERRMKIDAWGHATALLAMIDGLWLQWSLDPKSFTVKQAEALCLDYVDRVFAPSARG